MAIFRSNPSYYRWYPRMFDIYAGFGMDMLGIYTIITLCILNHIFYSHISIIIICVKIKR